MITAGLLNVGPWRTRWRPSSVQLSRLRSTLSYCLPSVAVHSKILQLRLHACSRRSWKKPPCVQFSSVSLKTTTLEEITILGETFSPSTTFFSRLLLDVALRGNMNSKYLRCKVAGVFVRWPPQQYRLFVKGLLATSWAWFQRGHTPPRDWGERV